jgi:hypothetical protein
VAVSLLDGQLAETFAAVFGAIYLDGSLYRAIEGADDGMGGGSGSGFAPAEPVKIQIDSASYAMQQADGYVEGDVRILMLAYGVAAPDTDAQIAGGGARYMVESVSIDAAGSYYELRGRKAA